MPVDPMLLPSRRSAALSCGLFALVATLLIGALASWLLLASYQRTVEDSARREAALLGGSVARTLAQQFEKAGRYGIPFNELPGIHAYLQRTLDDVPGLARIVLNDADGRTLDGVGRRGAPGRDTVAVPIAVNDRKLGSIAVTTAPAELTQAFGQVKVWCAGATLLIALLAGAAGALGAGALLDRRRAVLRGLLQDQSRVGFTHDSSIAVQGRDALAGAFRAVAVGEEGVRERVEAFDAYAQEVLAVDFDDRLRPVIEALVAEVHQRPANEVI